MEYWREMRTSYKVMAALFATLLLLFAVLYACMKDRQVLRFGDDTLHYRSENVLHGRLNGAPTELTVDGDTLYCTPKAQETVTYRLVDAPDALPDKLSFAMADSKYFTEVRGIEIYRNEERVFRGAYMARDSYLQLYHENGELDFTFVTVVGSEVSTHGAYGGPGEPHGGQLVRILRCPTPEKGPRTEMFAYGLLMDILGLITVLFAEQFFRHRMRWLVKDAESVEPSDWELFSRWLCWALCFGTALVCWILGLTK